MLDYVVEPFIGKAHRTVLKSFSPEVGPTVNTISVHPYYNDNGKKLVLRIGHVIVNGNVHTSHYTESIVESMMPKEIIFRKNYK